MRTPNHVFCYHHSPAQAGPEILAQLNLWRSSWRARGWFPRVLSELDARQHPRYAALSQRVTWLPTVNGAEYERACYIRWLAFQSSAVPEFPLVVSDYDAVNVGWSPDQMAVLARGAGRNVIHLDPEASPHAVWFSGPEFITSFVDAFFSDAATHEALTTEGGRSHVSDMLFFSKWVSPQTGLPPVCQRFDRTIPGYPPMLVHVASDAARKVGRAKSELMRVLAHQ